MLIRNRQSSGLEDPQNEDRSDDGDERVEAGSDAAVGTKQAAETVSGAAFDAAFGTALGPAFGSMADTSDVADDEAIDAFLAAAPELEDDVVAPSRRRERRESRRSERAARKASRKQDRAGKKSRRGGDDLSSVGTDAESDTDAGPADDERGTMSSRRQKRARRREDKAARRKDGAGRREKTTRRDKKQAKRAAKADKRSARREAKIDKRSTRREDKQARREAKVDKRSARREAKVDKRSARREAKVDKRSARREDRKTRREEKKASTIAVKTERRERRHQERAARRQARGGGLWTRLRSGLPTQISVSLRTVAVVVAITLVLGLVLWQNQRIGDLERQATTVDQMADVISDKPRTRSISLTVTDGSSVTVKVDVNGQAVIDASALPALAPGRTYQLWGATARQRVSLAVLGAEPGLEAFLLPSSVGSLAVTVEVEGGAAAASLPAVAFGTIDAEG